MAVAFSLAWASAVEEDVSTQTITFTQSGTPQGILVFAINLRDNEDKFTSITYGSVQLTPVAGGLALDGSGELLATQIYFAGSGLPSGTQTITATRTNDGDDTGIVAISVIADRDTEPTGIVLLQGDGTLAQQNVDDGSPGTNSLRFAGGGSGLASAPAVGGDSTNIIAYSEGGTGRSVRVVRETTAGQGSRPVGAVSGSSDDRAFVYVAIREVPRRIFNIN
jgi:hypothetical protein